MSSDESDEECQLGKHEHWEETYATELTNFKDHGSQGEIWKASAFSCVFQGCVNCQLNVCQAQPAHIWS